MRFVSHLACPTCGASYPADRVMNLCERDGRPVQMVLDLERLRAERGSDGGWDPSRRDLWRFGGLLPLDVADPDDRRHVVALGEGCTPSLPYPHPWADRLRCRLEVKDEGKGFDPQRVPDPLAPVNLERPGGRGVLLMRHYMTWVRYNRRGNRVMLCKRRL